MDEYQMTELEKTVEQFLRDLCKKWQECLRRDGKKATGDLIRSIKPLPLKTAASKLVGSIQAADYWKYVEKGRRPGKFPPVSKIEKWIEVKPVRPKPMNGKMPTTKQLAFLIARSIAANGIKPGKQFHEAFEWTWTIYEPKISAAVSKDMDRTLSVIYNNI